MQPNLASQVEPSKYSTPNLQKLGVFEFFTFDHFSKFLMALLEGTMTTRLLSIDVELEVLSVGVFIFFYHP